MTADDTFLTRPKPDSPITTIFPVTMTWVSETFSRMEGVIELVYKPVPVLYFISLFGIIPGR